MSTAAYQVQRSIYEALSGDDQLVAMLARGPQGEVGIYDSVPENARYPYLKIGGGDTETKVPATMLTAGRENLIQIHIWSRYSGQSEAKRIGERIVDRLTPSDPKLTYQLNLGAGWEFISNQYDFGEFFDDPDGISRHGVLRFRVRCQRTLGA